MGYDKELNKREKLFLCIYKQKLLKTQNLKLKTI